MFLQSQQLRLYPQWVEDRDNSNRFTAYRQRYCKERGLDEQDAIQIAKISGYQWLPLDAFTARAKIEYLRATRPDLVHHAERIEKKWNNAKSDALGLCAHASWGGAVFVTNDGNFHGKNHDELERLTRGLILRPHKAIAVIQRETGEQC